MDSIYIAAEGTNGIRQKAMGVKLKPNR